MADQFNIQSLFISSTFRDMQVERDLIRDKLFPKLNELSADYRKIIEVVDLRWGIDTSTIDDDYKAQEKILNVCLDEIDRCKPYIVVLLGDRYGWTPEVEMLQSVGETKSFPVREPKSVTALEIEYGALRSRHKPKAFFYFRSIENKQDIPDGLIKDYIGSNSERERLNKLKEEIRLAFPDNIREYSVVWDKNRNEISGLEGFEDIICSDILNAVKEDFGGNILPAAWQQKEINAQESVLFQKNNGFVGREKVIKEINDYLSNFTFPYILLKGASGGGKSSLFAHLVNTLQEGGDTVVFPFLCGTTGASSNLMTLLHVLIYQVAGRLKERYDYEFKDASEASDKLFELLGRLSKDKDYIIAVDALDELARGDSTNRMTWLLVNKLPDNVRFFGTIVDGPEVEAIDAAGAKIMELPALEYGDVDKIIEAFQKNTHKTLSPEVIKAIKNKRFKNGDLSSRSPLYLNLILQDLKMIDRYEFASIEKISANHNEALDKFMLDRISGSDGSAKDEYLFAIRRCEKLIGKEFVTACLGLIAASRFGLSEVLLEKCFESLGIKWESAAFAWLRQVLAPHFARSEYGEWDFNHRILRNTVWFSLLSHEEKKSFHKVIAAALEDSDNTSPDIVRRDIVCHYFWTYQYEKIAKYISSMRLMLDMKAVSQAFEVFLYMLNNYAGKTRENYLERMLGILDAIQGLSYDEKLHLLLSYSGQTKELIRQNVSIHISEAFYKKIIDTALELNAGAGDIHNKVLIMIVFQETSEFYIEEGYQKEAEQLFEKLEGIRLKYKDLIRNFSFEKAEYIGSAIKVQIAMTNRELSLALSNNDVKKAGAILGKSKRNLRLARVYQLLFSSKLALLNAVLDEKLMNFVMKRFDKEEYKPISILPFYMPLYFINREWNYIITYEMLNKEFDLYIQKNSVRKLDAIGKRINRIVMKENKFFTEFEQYADSHNFEAMLKDSGLPISNMEDVREFTNIMTYAAENIRLQHRLIESDEGIIEDKRLSVEFGENPGGALERYIKLAEFSERQYKKYGGILQTGNYAIRLENVAKAYFSLERYEDAFDWYLKATDILLTLIKHERYKDYEALTRCYEGMGRAALLSESEVYSEEAEPVFELVKNFRQDMKAKFPDIFVDSHLAVAYYNLGVAQNQSEKYDMSFKNFKTAFDLGDASAANYLGIAYEFGQGVEIDIEKAKEYYKQAYEMGDDYGRQNLERLR